MQPSPFTPGFGVTPRILAGRTEELRTFEAALDDGPGAMGRAMLFTGPRGSGKTVLLNAVEDVALKRGWVVASTTARHGFADELTHNILPGLLRDIHRTTDTYRITGAEGTVLGVGGGLTREHVDRFPVAPSIWSRIRELTEALPESGGLLITVDEVHSSALDDLREIAQAVQHSFREGRQVAFAAAGLPSSISDLLSSDVVTFLRRAERFTLTHVPIEEVEDVLEDTIQGAGRTIGRDALTAAADGTYGYAFLIQLVGHHIWQAERSNRHISLEHAASGVARARRRVGDLVHASALADLSGVDRSFLVAMSIDDGPSNMNEIPHRLGVGANYASQYRLRLIDAGMIEAVGRGRVDFTLPYIREYLRDHAASLGLSRRAKN